MARPEMSPEAREKLSRIAKERHRSGELGTPKPGSHLTLEDRIRGGKTGGNGRSKRRTRITKRVAEAAEDEANAKAIIEVFKDAIHPNQPMAIRLKGAEAWAKIAADHHKTEVAEQANEHVERSREELIAILQGKLTSGPVASILQQQIEAETGIRDADVIEVEGEVMDDAA